MNLNLEYWQKRYSEHGGQKTVGNISIQTQQAYEAENQIFKNNMTPLFPEQVNTVLDFGYGIGRWTTLLKQYAEAYYATDIIEAVPMNTPYFDLIDDNGTIPFGDTKFDFIFTCVVLQHVVDEDLLNNYIKQFYHRLEDDGYIVITENTFKAPDKDYLSFRPYEHYVALFEDNNFKMIDKKTFLSCNEEHTSMLFRKKYFKEIN